ncbi:MAG TPA: S8 family peptidase, partial [Symbiobacteriaceae bacterium]|nr:S8 family peptidase [Symbiobacteriaceae bacterium]
DQLTWVDQLTWTDGQQITIDWGARAVGSPAAHQGGNRGQGVRVAILDTGIDSTHPDLSVAGGINVIDPAAGWADDNGHGTAMAGIIAASGRHGLTGVAPDVSLYAVKVLDADGAGYLGDVVRGLDWAIAQKVQVVSISLGSHAASRALAQAIDRAREAGITVVASAGNGGRPNGKGMSLDYPATIPGVLSIGAVGPNLQRAPFSATGNELDFMAPGVGILSTFPGGYAVGTGTSHAAAYASGVVALLLAERPGLGPDEVETILKQEALPLVHPSPDRRYGYGLLRLPGR